MYHPVEAPLPPTWKETVAVLNKICSWDSPLGPALAASLSTPAPQRSVHDCELIAELLKTLAVFQRIDGSTTTTRDEYEELILAISKTSGYLHLKKFEVLGAEKEPAEFVYVLLSGFIGIFQGLETDAHHVPLSDHPFADVLCLSSINSPRDLASSAFANMRSRARALGVLRRTFDDDSNRQLNRPASQRVASTGAATLQATISALTSGKRGEREVVPLPSSPLPARRRGSMLKIPEEPHASPGVATPSRGRRASIFGGIEGLESKGAVRGSLSKLRRDSETAAAAAQAHRRLSTSQWLAERSMQDSNAAEHSLCETLAEDLGEPLERFPRPDLVTEGSMSIRLWGPDLAVTDIGSVDAAGMLAPTEDSSTSGETRQEPTQSLTRRPLTFKSLASGITAAQYLKQRYRRSGIGPLGKPTEAADDDKAKNLRRVHKVLKKQHCTVQDPKCVRVITQKGMSLGEMAVVFEANRTDTLVSLDHSEVLCIPAGLYRSKIKRASHLQWNHISSGANDVQWLMQNVSSMQVRAP